MPNFFHRIVSLLRRRRVAYCINGNRFLGMKRSPASRYMVTETFCIAAVVAKSIGGWSTAIMADGSQTNPKKTMETLCKLSSNMHDP